MGTSSSPLITPQPWHGSLGVPGATSFAAVPGVCGCTSLFGWLKFLFHLSFCCGGSVSVTVSWALSEGFGILLQTADF